MPGNPTDIGGAPIDITLGLNVKDNLVGIGDLS